MKKPKANSKPKEVELEPDAWERFERAVKIVAKSPPLHRMKQNRVAGVAESEKSDSNAPKKKSGRRP
jgi:hypothetical protein